VQFTTKVDEQIIKDKLQAATEKDLKEAK